MKRCPNCNREVQWQDNPFRPFCSERCQLIDLGKWVSEEYRVPGKAVPTEAVEDNEEDSRVQDSSSSEFKL
jgi:endogenous inhibitor of DNA gyrase (YacG/DUF329 family)